MNTLLPVSIKQTHVSISIQDSVILQILFTVILTMIREDLGFQEIYQEMASKQQREPNTTQSPILQEKVLQGIGL